MDETYVKVSGRCVYLYRTIDQFSQVIDVLVWQKLDQAATLLPAASWSTQIIVSKLITTG